MKLYKDQFTPAEHYADVTRDGIPDGDMRELLKHLTPHLLDKTTWIICHSFESMNTRIRLYENAIKKRVQNTYKKALSNDRANSPL